MQTAHQHEADGSVTRNEATLGRVASFDYAAITMCECDELSGQCSLKVVINFSAANNPKILKGDTIVDSYCNLQATATLVAAKSIA
jgi:hypothetical protein